MLFSSGKTAWIRMIILNIFTCNEFKFKVDKVYFMLFFSGKTAWIRMIVLKIFTCNECQVENILVNFCMSG